MAKTKIRQPTAQGNEPPPFEPFDDGKIFSDEEATPPVIDLPTTEAAVDGLIDQVSISKQQADELRAEVERIRKEHVQELGARTDAEADLAMIRRRVVELEAQLAQATQNCESARVESSAYAERLLNSELKNNDLERDLKAAIDTLDKIRSKKIWIVMPRRVPGQSTARHPQDVRLHVLASDVIEAIERAIKAGMIRSREDVATTSVAIETLIF